MRRALLVVAVLVALGLALAGCSPILGLFVRAAAAMGAPDRTALTLGARVTSSTSETPDRYSPPCGAADGGGDRAYEFVAPADGRFRFEVSAHYDSVLALFDPEDRPLACNDDAGRATHSMLDHDLRAGERVTVVVDGFRGATGDFELWVELAPTPAAPAPSADAQPLALDQRLEGDTRDRPDTITPSCGAAAGSPDHSWVFTPDVDGPYTITVDSTFDAVLAIYNPSVEEPIACNDDHGSTRASQVSVALRHGVAYRVVVDGFRGERGAYGILARRLAPPPRARPTGVVGEGMTVRGDTRHGAHTRTHPCGGTEGSPDQTWRFRPRRTELYVMRVDATFDATLALYELQGDEPLACSDDEGAEEISELTLRLEAGHVYELSVDGVAGAAGVYTLSVLGRSTAAAPRALELARGIPASLDGGTDLRTLSCAPAGARPEARHRLRAPVAGTYAIAIEGLSGATLGVSGPEASTRACAMAAADAPFGARVELTLAAEEEIEVVVEGATATGDYLITATRVSPETP